jgi:hypothetical protein
MLDTVTRSMRMVGIIEAGETPSAEDAVDGLVILNDMLHGWAKEGVELNHVTLAAAQSMPYDDSYMEGIRYNLAARMGVEWGRQISPLILARAAAAFQAFQAHTLEFHDDLHVDRALQPQHFSGRRGGYNIDEG